MKAKIFTNDFNRIIAATKGFVNKDDTKKLYKFIRLEFHSADSSITAVAVDGYRLSVEHAVCECDKDFVAYINADTKLPGSAEASIEVVNGETIIRCNDHIYGCRMMDGEFLDWENVLPKDDPTFRFGVNGEYLLSALQAAKVSCGKSFKQPVVLEFRGELTPVILRTNKDDIKMVLPVRIRGGTLMKTTPRRDSFAATTDDRYSDKVCPACGYGIRRDEATARDQNGKICHADCIREENDE